MKKFLKILCVSALITCMMAVNVSAARFTFTFNNSGQIVPHLRLKEIQAIVLQCLLQRQVIILTSML